MTLPRRARPAAPGGAPSGGGPGGLSAAPAHTPPSSPPGVGAGVAPADAAVSWGSRARWGLVLGGLVAGTVYLTWSVLAVLTASVVFAYLLDRPVTWLAKKGVSRDVAFLVWLLVGAAAVVVFALVVVPVLVAQFSELATNLTPYLTRLGEQLRPYKHTIEKRIGAPVPVSVESLQAVLPEYARKLADLPNAGDVAKDVLAQVATGGAHFVVSALTLALIPVFTFYVCRDFPEIRAGADALVPPRWRGTVREIAGEIDTRVMAYVRGQALLCVILGVLYSVGLLASGIDLAVLVGMVSGFLFLIPYAGAVLGVGVACALALLKFGLDWHVLGAAATFFVVHFIESTFLTPNIVGDRVGLHPLVVMVGVVVCGNLMGVWGLMVAVPLTAAVAVLGGAIVKAWRASRFYGA